MYSLSLTHTRTHTLTQLCRENEKLRLEIKRLRRETSDPDSDRTYYESESAERVVLQHASTLSIGNPAPTLHISKYEPTP